MSINGSVPKEIMQPSFAELVDEFTHAEQRRQAAITRVIVFAVALGGVFGVVVTWLVLR